METTIVQAEPENPVEAALSERRQRLARTYAMSAVWACVALTGICLILWVVSAFRYVQLLIYSIMPLGVIVSGVTHLYLERHGHFRAGVYCLLVGSLATVAVGPLVMPEAFPGATIGFIAIMTHMFSFFEQRKDHIVATLIYVILFGLVIAIPPLFPPLPGNISLTVEVLVGVFSMAAVSPIIRAFVLGQERHFRGARQSQGEAEEARRAAEAANQAKSVFLTNMSHELRTPLNAILGFSEMMAKAANLTGDQHENLGIINRSGVHLLGLINDVLEMSKIEAGRTVLNEEVFDLCSLLGELEEMFRLRAQAKNLRLILDCGFNVSQYVATDRGKVRQIVLNLVSNAIKFTQEGGVTIRSRQEAADDSSLILYVEVEDTGAGIAPEEMGGLFEAFVQTEAGRHSQQGTGLGLPISREFVRFLGGEMTVSSQVGVGTVFKFHIRARIPGEAEIAGVDHYQAPRRVVGLEAGQPTYRILIVEDRSENRVLLLRLLQPLDFELRQATNGQECVEIWEEWQPHLIWMDMRMPVMDGYEATRHIKGTTQGQATIIVALTASAFEEDKKMILSEGCDDFVRKPFRERDIFDALTRHLGVRFVYEDAAVERPAEEVDLSGLAGLPVEWLEQVHEAAISAHGDRILELAEEVRDQQPAVADAIAGMANNFQFDDILDMVERSAPQ